MLYLEGGVSILVQEGTKLLIFSENNYVQPTDIDYLIVLNTEKMQWEKAKYEGNAPRNRYGHTATSIGPHILIFGGWEFNRATN